MKKILFLSTVVALLSGCAGSGNGELIGGTDRLVWNPTDPYGMVFIAEVARVGEQRIEVIESAVLVVDVEVVGDVVTVIVLRRRVARIEPDGFDAERRDVAEP